MNPAIGTFTTMDTYQGSTFDPVLLHKYLYANANPVMYVDSSGYMTSLQDVQAGEAGEVPLEEASSISSKFAHTVWRSVITGTVFGGLDAYRQWRTTGKIDWGHVFDTFVITSAASVFFGVSYILGSAMQSTMILTALGGSSVIFAGAGLAQAVADGRAGKFDLVLIDLVFAGAAVKGAKSCYDSTVKIASAKNTAETVTVPTPENTNTAKEISKAELVRQNYANGEKAELAQYELELKEYPNTKRQVSIRAYDGNGNLSIKRTRVDLFNEKGIIEVKASKNAPLTNNQKALYPLIAKNGGRVVGIKYGSYDIPPQDIYITRDGVTVLLFSKGG